ncbi:GNAT family N-acetyltransferase [Halosimplex rubrum]|uniref:GNAT family N-acetyltransferase n=1 Tax=Halosimplex rubrum TaxID=869889 RepID=UPI001FEAEACF|nr:GNAT family N-acetyltransferase [Halosimplex rubrum]
MTLVRPAREGDTAPLRETHVAAIEAFGPEAYDERAVAAWADRGDDPSLEGLDDPDTYWVVAERGEGPPVAGFGRLDAAAGEVVAVYVHPDCARSGVGSAVLASLEGYARGAGLNELALTASLNAVGFYERHGYRAGEDVTLSIGDGVEIDCVEMRKSL